MLRARAALGCVNIHWNFTRVASPCALGAHRAPYKPLLESLF